MPAYAHPVAVAAPLRKLLGYQIADDAGVNIQGDDGDPSGQPSFRILSPVEAQDILENCTGKFLLCPIFEGDIENPSFS